MNSVVTHGCTTWSACHLGEQAVHGVGMLDKKTKEGAISAVIRAAPRAWKRGEQKEWREEAESDSCLVA